MTTAIYRILLLSLCLGVSARAADLRIACVDMSKVFDEYYKTRTAQANLHQTRTTYRKHALEQQASIEADAKKVVELREQAQNIALNEEARAALAEESRKLDNLVRQRRRDAIQYNQAKLKDLMDNYMKERDSILVELNKWIKNYAQSNTYDLVIDTSGNSSNNIPTVVYYNPAMDITTVAIAAMNKGHETEKAMADEQIRALEAQEAEDTGATTP